MKKFAQEKLQVRFEVKNYSRLGLASFLIAILAGLIVIVDISIGMRGQNDPSLVPQFQALDVWLTWLTAVLAFAGIVLGIAGAAQRQRKRLFGLIGLIVNGLFLLTIFSLYMVNTVGFLRLAGRGG